MKPYVSHNGGECILDGIMGCNLFPIMGVTKKVVLARFRGAKWKNPYRIMKCPKAG
jgi:hypothetical protein